MIFKLFLFLVLASFGLAFAVLIAFCVFELRYRLQKRSANHAVIVEELV
jgi:hypothetical protein